MTTLQQLETEDLFQKHIQQLEKEKSAGQIRTVEKVRISDAEIVRYTSNETMEMIVVVCQVAKVEFWIDVQSGNVVKGNRRTVLKCYEKVSLMREKGTAQWRFHAESQI